MNWNDILNYASKGNPEPDKVISKTDEEWASQLSEEEFRVTRLKGTERPFSGEYCESHEQGKYNCVCCGSPLFESTIKFDSGTGWPSFTAPIKENAIAYIMDKSHGMTRVEVVCNNCKSH